MGDMPDDRRAHQEPQKANGGDGSQRHAGNHFPGFLGHAVAERDNGRGAKAHQQQLRAWGAVVGGLLQLLLQKALFAGALVIAGLFTFMPGRIMHAVVFGA